jgi:ADP-heptose:LPS heptosyltransferase
MKLNIEKIPFNDFLGHHKLLSLIIDLCLLPFFAALRIINRLFVGHEGAVLVIMLNKLGDTVFTIPAVRLIQRYFPGKIIMICFPESIPIYKLAIDDLNFREIRHEDFFFGGRIARSKARHKISSLKPYIIFDLTGTMISASLIFNIRAKQIIGINGIHFRTIYDHFIAFRENPNLIDLYLDAISPLIQIPNRSDLKKQPLVLNPSGKILIHPFAGWKAKEWNFNKYYKLAVNLSRYYKIALVVPINNISNDIAEELILEGVEIIQSSSVENLIEDIKSCSIFIGNDSGPIYIASLLGKPTISIYGPTNPEYSRPIGEHHHVIVHNIKCSPEKNKQYCFTYAGMLGCLSFECMNLLEYDDVYFEIKELIKNKSFVNLIVK